MIREIDRCGWEIELHPSWYSFDDADELKRQKEALEKALGHEIVSIRQHYLQSEIPLVFMLRQVSNMIQHLVLMIMWVFALALVTPGISMISRLKKSFL